MLPICLPRGQDVDSDGTMAQARISEKEPSMKTRLFINRERYIRRLVKLAAFSLLATPVFAQTYTVTDLGTLGRNSLGSYSVAYCINSSGQVAGESSAASTQRSDPGFLHQWSTHQYRYSGW